MNRWLAVSAAVLFSIAISGCSADSTNGTAGDDDTAPVFDGDNADDGDWFDSDFSDGDAFQDEDSEAELDDDTIKLDGDQAEGDEFSDGDGIDGEVTDREADIDGDKDTDSEIELEDDTDTDTENCPEMWEGPAPPDCKHWDCELQPWPSCWVCDLAADPSQNGLSCEYCDDQCECIEPPCKCLNGNCIPDSAVDGDGETDADWESDTELNGEEDETTVHAIERIVIAGDSWSCGIVAPTRAILDERGFSDIEITYSTTAVAGSTAEEWVYNHDNKLLKLTAALDEDPQAELLLLVIGGNDVNASIYNDGFDAMSDGQRAQVLDGIRDDIRAIVDFARLNRPHLSIVLVGYDYFHYLFLQAFYGLGDMYLDEYNLAFVGLGNRKLEIANQVNGCYYAHNYGVLQYTFGDRPHPPFSLPLFEYPPGYVPAPGIAPDYTPFPGGLYQIPSPLDQIPDGIHPSEEGFSAIMNHVFDQGMENLLLGNDWVTP